MLGIQDEEIYYVGFSNGKSENRTHYICVWNQSETATDIWCKAIKEKGGSDTVKLILTGKDLKHYLAR